MLRRRAASGDGHRLSTCTKSRNGCTFSGKSACSLLSHTRSYFGSEDLKGFGANLLVCVADVRYFMKSAHLPVPFASAFVGMPSTRHARELKPSGVAAAIPLRRYGHTHTVKVTRDFRYARAQRCEVLMHGGWKVERRVADASGVPYLRELCCRALCEYALL